MPQALIGRWGRNLAVRFPADVANAVGLEDGERVEVLAQEREVVIRKLTPGFTVSEMFRGKTPEEWRALCRRLRLGNRSWPRDRRGMIEDAYLPDHANDPAVSDQRGHS